MDCAVQNLRGPKAQVSTACRMVDGDHGSRARVAAHDATDVPPESPSRRTMAANVSIAPAGTSFQHLSLSRTGSAGAAGSQDDRRDYGQDARTRQRKKFQQNP